LAAIAAWCNQKFARIESLRTRTFPRGSCFQPHYYFPKMVNLTNFYSKQVCPPPVSTSRSTGDGNQHKHDGQSAGAPSDVAQRRDPARGPPPRGPKRFRGEADLVTLVRRVQAGIAGKVAQQTAAADAQADAEANGRPPARPVDAARGHLGQHDRTVLFQGQ
jgi:hypothetical protein